ncbi:MAG: DUF4926 domain-containing protein [bacterium]|nr:DUF4926 domain-containing protein [bacterium]
MNKKFKLLDVVALLEDLPAANLLSGQVGTIVELFDSENFEVEFCNKKGETITTYPVNSKDVLLLHYEMEAV